MESNIASKIVSGSGIIMLLSLNSCSFSESLSPLISFSVIDLLKIICSIAFNIGSFSSFFDELKKVLFDEFKKLVFLIRF